MLTRSRILFYWLLLLVPTLFLGVWGWRLLVREEERLAQAGELARLERVSVTVENIELFLEDVKGAVVEGLIGLPEVDPEAAMTAWRDDNPFVRQVFVWRPAEALVFPDPEEPAGDDEVRFVRRYRELLGQAGSWPRDGTSFRWRSDVPAPEQEEAASAPASPRRDVQRMVQEDRYARSLRERESAPATALGTMSRAQEPAATGNRSSDDYAAELFADRQESVGAEAPAESRRRVEGEAVRTIADRGWIPWYGQTDWSVLGWIELAPGGEIRGAELELEEVYGRLEILLDDAVAETEILALIDGDGEVFSVAGGENPPETEPAHVLPIGVMLPNWRVAVYPLPGRSPGGGFLIISLLLLGAFLAAILSGGSLLLWQAYRNALDARRKSGFVSNVSHELKTPLTTLRMYAELLEDSRNNSEEKRDRYLSVIRSETERLTRLVNNVLDFSRLERRRKSYRRETFDAGALLQAFLEHQQPRIREAGLAVSYEGPDDGSLTVCADRDALEQVFLNLLDNAAKYAAAGGELAVTAGTENGFVRIRFMDRGPGIAPAHRERIFEEFHRVDDTLTATHPGCGLGLNIARQLLRGQDGDLACGSRAGGGSVFTITLPRVNP